MDIKTIFDTALSLEAQGADAVSFLHDASGLQDSFSCRCQKSARDLSRKLIAEDGRPLPFTGKVQRTFYANGLSDEMLFKRQEKFLELYNASLIDRIQKFSLPLCHKGAERLIRETLLLAPGASLTDGDVRQAILSSCLTVLRQTVGSCFATAPAILVHEEQILLYLDDLFELLTTGRLKRVVEGVEYAVPLSPGWGRGDLGKIAGEGALFAPGIAAALQAGQKMKPGLSLKEKLQEQAKLVSPLLAKKLTVEHLIETVVSPLAAGSIKAEEAKAAFKAGADNALLKAWEFTLASFSEVKMEFSRWNLYESLGLNPEAKGGVGAVLYAAVDSYLQEAHQKGVLFQNEYFSAYDQLRMAERMLSQAASDGEARRFRAQCQAQLHHMQSCKEIIEKQQEAAKKFSVFFSFLIRQYDAKFPEFFQEIYDSEMAELSGQRYDDRPAGFRLVYKHGRKDASLWTPIYEGKEFVRSLADFFIMTESRIADLCETEEEKKKLTDATSRVIAHVRSEEFLQAAIRQSAKTGRTPWAYTSGGTVETLVKTYFGRRGKISQEGRWVDSPLDLLIFIIDTLKGLPPKIMELFARDPEKRMLMQSPVHAFCLKPGWSFVREGWEENGFTYSWARDRFILPMQRFYDEMRLSRQEQIFLMQKQSLLFETKERCSIAEFKQLLVESGCREADAFLYRALPVVSRQKCQAALQRIAGTREEWDLPPFLLSSELVSLAKGISIKEGDVHLTAAEELRDLGLAPRPFLFADSNWSSACFSFVVNPASGEVELWRTDPTGVLGTPMAEWAEYVSGVDKTPWVIYTHPFEYLFKN